MVSIWNDAGPDWTGRVVADNIQQSSKASVHACMCKSIQLLSSLSCSKVECVNVETYRHYQDIIGDIELAACVCPVLPLEGLAVLAGDCLAHWVHIYTLRLQVVALQAQPTL